MKFQETLIQPEKHVQCFNCNLFEKRYQIPTCRCNTCSQLQIGSHTFQKFYKRSASGKFTSSKFTSFSRVHTLTMCCLSMIDYLNTVEGIYVLNYDCCCVFWCIVICAYNNQLLHYSSKMSTSTHGLINGQVLVL